MPHNHSASNPSTAASAFVGKSLLLVEDDRSIRLLLAHALERRGFNVVACSDGKSALRTLDQAASLNVAVVDLGLPDIDGYQIAQHVKRTSTSQTLLVAITGLGGEKERQTAAQAGFDLFVLKPFDPEELMRLIESKLR